MGKKERLKKQARQLKPFCWYCEREFEDEKVLISHQRAKHFKCHICYKRLNTAGGLSVHCMQVHKEQITKIPNAVEGRDTVELEIYGMEGVPEEDKIERWEGQKAKVSEELQSSRKKQKTEAYNTVYNQVPAQSFQPVPAGLPNPGSFPPPGMPGLPPPGFAMPFPQPGANFQFPSAQSNPQGAQAAAFAAYAQQQAAQQSQQNSQDTAASAPQQSQPTAQSAPAQPQSTPAAPAVKLLYDNDSFSLEEMRAQLPKYSFGTEEMAAQVASLDQSIENRLRSLQGYI